MKVSLPLLVVAFFGIVLSGRAQEYQGAATLLRRLAEDAVKAPADPLAARPAGRLREEIENFPARAATLSPQDAAAHWLALVDRYAALYREERGDQNFRRPYKRFAFESVLAALPPPNTWPELLKAIEARPRERGRDAVINAVLKLVGHTLIDDADARWADAAEVRQALAKIPGQGNYYAPRMISRALLQIDPDPERIVADFAEQVAEREQRGDDPQDDLLSVTDLVALTDEATAASLLERALLLPTRDGINIVDGPATRALARQLAWKLAPKLKTPPWGIMDSLDSAALFEVMDERFPAKTADDFQKREIAVSYYLVGLMASGRAAEAPKYFDAFNHQASHSLSLATALNSLIHIGRGSEAFAFLREWLTHHPEMVAQWFDINFLSTRLGQTSEMRTAWQAAIKREDLPAVIRLKLRGDLAVALLAADHIEEGVTEMRAIIAGPSPRELAQSENTNRIPDRDRRYEFAAQVAQVGRLMNRPDWLSAGLDAARRLVEDRLGFDLAGASPLNFARLLRELDLGGEAEKCFFEETLRSNRAPDDRGEALLELVRLYGRAGRFDDVLALLDQAPGWGVDGLLKLPAAFDDFTSVLLFAAQALVHNERKDEARKLVDYLLQIRPNLDPAYALLIQIEGPNALARLYALAAHDPFEERPLIWTAQLLLNAGQLEEAEKSARAALAIDPSDGDQPQGDRLRAYSILANLVEKKGDTAQAETLRKVVEAIRLSETSYAWWYAGLHTRAVQQNEKTLSLFDDAYCIHSLLAWRCIVLGQPEKAREHYARAYELMPDSFGRVESHCLGCEEVFSGAKAQAAAEKVFAALVKQSPAKPQAHYLLGYVREKEGRPVEALESYQRAVALDPDYLNAWRKMAELRENFGIPTSATDAALLQQIRLDPLQRHGAWNTLVIADLKAYWLAIETAGKKQLPLPDPLYPLAASKAAMERAAFRRPDSNDNFSSRRDPFPTPGEAIARTAILESAASTLNSLSGD